MMDFRKFLKCFVIEFGLMKNNLNVQKKVEKVFEFVDFEYCVYVVLDEDLG